MTENTKRPNLPSSVHFVGIGGSGMSGLAHLALAHGLQVSGSDIKSSKSSVALENSGARVFHGHSGESLPECELVVYSSAIKSDNPELLEAKRRGYHVCHRSDLLALFMQYRKPITIAGTHGKTTTTAMAAHMLSVLGCDPEALVGATMLNTGTAHLAGGGEYFVAEVDESDGTLVKYAPFVSVITNIEFDHMEYFGTKERLLEVFSRYLKNTHEDGLAVVGWDSPLVRECSEVIKNQRLTYGFLLGSEVRAINYRHEDGKAVFTAIVEREQFTCRIHLPGRHNVQNALCCLAIARALDLDIQAAVKSLESFHGTERRTALIGSSDSVAIYDDYAHNPGKIAACLMGLKQMWPNRHLIAIFQPHRYSRLLTMRDEMYASLKLADTVVVVPVYSAGEPESPGFTPEEMAAGIRSITGKSVVAAQDFDAVVENVCKNLPAQAIIVTVGAGDISKVAQQLAHEIAGVTVAGVIDGQGKGQKNSRGPS